MKDGIKKFYEFEEFRLDVDMHRLHRDGELVPLTPKAVETLLTLIERRGRVVEREDLMTAVWHDTVVEDQNLSVTISMLRKALGEDRNGTRFIETVPRQGYCFVAKVREIEEEVPALLVEKRTLTRTVIEKEITNSDTLLPKGRSQRKGVALLILGTVVLCAVGLSSYMNRKGVATTGTSASAPAFGVSSSNSEAGPGKDFKLTTDFGFADEIAQAIVLQPGGKFIAAGRAGESLAICDFALARYNSDGSLDDSFGTGGKVITRVGSYTDIIYALALQADGKILAAGVTFTGNFTRRFALARYHLDGSLDSSFDGDGIVTLSVGTRGADTAYAVAVQPDNKIVVSGSSAMLIPSGPANLGQNDFALVRFNPDGSLDTDFGNKGKVITDFGSGADVAYAMALQPDGRIVITGAAANGANQDFGLARYNVDGSPDESFGLGGKVRTDFFDRDDVTWALTLEADGRILVAGYAFNEKTAEVTLARYKTDGSLDNTFGKAGKVTTDVAAGGGLATSVKLQTDGKIVIAGAVNDGLASEFLFARYHPDGSLDTSFDNDGKTTSSLMPVSKLLSMVLQPDGQILAAGQTGNGKTSHFAVIRFLP